MTLMMTGLMMITHWGRVTHICVGKLTIIGSDNGLSPERRQAIIWTNAGILLIGPLGTNFSEILIGIQTFSFKKMHLKMSSATWRLFGLGLNELTHLHLVLHICVIKLGIISSGNGLSPIQRQAITWTNVALFSIKLPGTNFSEIQIKIQDCSFIKMHLKIMSA